MEDRVLPAAFPTPLEALAPLGGQVHERTAADAFAAAGETDAFTLDVDAGQRVALVLAPDDPSLWARVRLLGPGGAELGAAEAAAPGRAVVLPATATGSLDSRLTFEVTALEGTGPYRLTAVLNAAVDVERAGGRNDDPAAAQDLDGTALSLGGGTDRLAARGVSDASPDLYGFTLAAGQHATLVLGAGAGAGLQLLDSSGGLLALGEARFDDEAGRVADFVAPAAGRYLARVSGPAGDGYALVITRGAAFEAEPNDLLPQADGPGGPGVIAGALRTAAAPYLGAEQEPNGSIAGANDLSGNFTPVGGSGYTASVGGAISTTDDADYFRIYASPGDRLVLDQLGQTLSDSYLYLYNSAGTQLAANDDWDTLDAHIEFTLGGPDSNYAGDYYVRADAYSTRTGTYTLTVQITTPALLRRNDRADVHAIPAAAGAALVLTTATPADAPGQPENLLDPILELYAPDGTLVASNNNGAPDGRNARLSYAVPAGAGGVYAARVAAVTGQGEYVLQVEGAAAPAPVLRVTSSSPAGGSAATAFPAAVRLGFSGPLLLSTLQAGDLTVNGRPAAGVTVVDARTVDFAVAGLADGDGTYTAVLAGGAVRGLQGQDSDSFTLSFRLDTTGPAVAAATPAAGGAAAPGVLVATVNFDEPLDPAGLGPEDVRLEEALTGTVLTPDTLRYDAGSREVTLRFPALPEGRYALTLAAGAFRDPLGNPLGAAADRPEGRDAVVPFVVDVDTGALPAPLAGVAPAGSLVSEGLLPGAFHFVEDEDTYTLDLDPGQVLSIEVRPGGAAAAARLRLVGPGGELLAEATGAAGEAVALSSVPAADAGEYRVEVASRGDGGHYDLRVVLNAGLEAETAPGGNDTTATAESLGASAVAVAAADRLAVLGTGDGGDDCYALSLAVGQSADLVLAGPGEGAYELRLEDAAGRVLALGLAGAAGPGGAVRHVAGFVAPAAGTYVARVTAPAGARYSLVATRGLGFEVEPNDAVDAAAPLPPAAAVLGAVAPRPGDDLAEGNAWQWSAWDSEGGATWVGDDASRRRDGDSSLHLGTGSGLDVTLAYPATGAANLDLTGQAALAVSFYAVNPSPVGFQNASPWIRLGSADGYFQYQTATDLLNDARGAWLDVRIPLAGDGVWARTVSGAPSLDAIDWLEIHSDTWDAGFNLWVDGVRFLADDADGTAVRANPGDVLVLQTATPGDGGGEPANGLYPRLELYAPGGTLVAADDNGAADGRNARLGYTVPAGAGGVYRAVVRAAGGFGAYVLTVAGATGGPGAFAVAASTPAAGAALPAFPAEYRVSLSAPVLLTSVDPGDLLVNGQPAAAVTVVDGVTLAFDVGGLDEGEGAYTVALAAGALTALDGRPLAAYAASLVVDQSPPRVTGTSPAEGGVAPAGPVSVTVDFDEPLSADSLGAEDVAVTDRFTGAAVVPSSFAYDGAAHRLTLGFADLPEGGYLVRLLSGPTGFRDAAGNPLDGDDDGAAGGDFVLTFATDRDTAALPAPAAAVAPLGSLVYESTTAGLTHGPMDVDYLALQPNPNVTLTVLVTPRDEALQPRVELQTFTGTEWQTVGVAAGTAGTPALLQAAPVVAAGTYRIALGSLAGAGRSTVRVVYNAALEVEPPSGGSNDTRGTAQDLGPTFVPLGGAAARGAVLGVTDGAAGGDYYSVDLTGGQPATLAVTGLAGAAAGGLTLALEDGAGAVLARGATGSSNVGAVIAGFVPAATGRYLVRVGGDAGQAYSLVVTRGSDFSVEPNGDSATARDLGSASRVLGALSPTGAGGGSVRVAVVSAGSQNSGLQAVVNQLNNDTYFDFTASLVTAGQVDSAAELRGYDVVVLGDPGYNTNQFDVLAPALRAWVESGGGVVATGWTIYGAGSATPPAVTDLDAILPVNSAGSYGYSYGGPITLAAAAHPVTAGLGSFSLSDSYIEYPAGSPAVDAGATVLATTYGRPTVVAGQPGQGRAVYLGPIYAGGSGYSLAELRSGSADRLLEQAVAWAGRNDREDDYLFRASAGDQLVLTTSTPGDGGGEPANGLDPRLDLYAPDGTLVAGNDNGAPDGRNALLTYTVPAGAGGTYRVAVRTFSGAGDYVLEVGGATGANPAFRVTAATPADGALLAGFPATYRIDLSQPVLLTSVDAGDLRVNGVPASALSVVDPDTLEFAVAGADTGDGLYTVTVDAGALVSLSGAALTAYTAAFDSDTTSPRVVASSLGEGDTVAPGDLVFAVRFSEGLATADLGPEDVTLVDGATGRSYAAQALAYDAASATATVSYRGLPEGEYTLTLLTSASAFRDRRGNLLDGSPSVPLPSGDGTPGDPFVVHFRADAAEEPFPAAFPALPPFGGLVSQSGVIAGRFHAAGDADTYALAVDGGQAVSVRLAPDDSPVRARVEWVDPDGVVTAAEAGAAGGVVLLQAAPAAAAGLYRLRLVSRAGVGAYQVQVTLNAAVEAEGLGGGDNGTPASAQPLGAAATPLPGGASRLAVVGRLDGAADVDVYAVPLAAGQAATFIAAAHATAGAAAAVRVRLLDASGAVLALGTAQADGAQRIDHFVPAAAGTYLLQVTGPDAAAYTLLATRGAAFDREPNNRPEDAQGLNLARVALGGVGAGELFSLRGTPVAGPYVLTGTQLVLGFNRDGSFITDNSSAGIRYNGVEFVVPGSPQASFTIARNGQNFQNNAPAGGSATAVTFEDISAGDLLGVRIVGTVGGNLRLERVVAFQRGDAFATIATRLTNLSGAPLTGVAWLENMDPDQGSSLGLGSNTSNDVVADGRFVRSSVSNGAYPGGLSIGLGSADERSVASAEGFDVGDPFAVLDSPVDPGGAGDDIAINLAFRFGTLAAGEAVEGAMLLVLGPSTAAADATYAANAGRFTQGGGSDVWSFDAAVGDVLSLTTDTPGGGSGVPDNGADPALELSNPLGFLVAADDNGAPDGRNARIVYVVPPGGGGRYTVRVGSPARGEYTLQLAGAAGAADPGPAVAASSPADGQKVAAAPAALTLTLTEAVLAGSVQADDLALDGGAGVTGVEVIDGRTVRFSLAVPNVETTYHVSLAAGAFLDLQGNPSAPFTGSFQIDRTGPRVVAQTPALQASAPFTRLAVTFDEDLDPATFTTDDVTRFTGPGGVNLTGQVTSVTGSGRTFVITFAAQSAQGTYTLTFGPDVRDVVGNPMASAATATVDLQSPDLGVRAVSVSPAAGVRFGDTVGVTWTARNTGTDPASERWSDRVYLSRNATFSADDVLLATLDAGSASPLAPGAEYTRTASVRLPLSPSLTAGTYYVLVVADALGQQPEANEGNNVGAGEAVPLTLPPLPDLVVSAITAPAAALSGQAIPVRWTLSNQGTGAATGTWTDYVYLATDAAGANRQFFGAFDFTGTIPAGGAVERIQTLTLPATQSGDRWVVVQTDAGNAVYEHDREGNNTAVDDRRVEVTLQPFPNLVVSSVVPPTSAFSSQQTTVSWTVSNTGNGPTSAPVWYDRVYLSPDRVLDGTDVLLGTAANPSYLNAGESYTGSLTVTLPRGLDGSYFYLVQADAYSQVLEFNHEDDNVTAGGPSRVQLTPPPDLQVDAVTTPATGFSGQPLTVSWTVSNHGPGRTLEGAWYDEVYLSADAVLDGSDRPLGRVYHAGALDPAAGYAASLVATLPTGVAGDFYFLVQTDSLNHVYEQAFEGNNVGRRAVPARILLTPPPDLATTAVAAPAEALAGRPLTVGYTVTNEGSTPTLNASWTDTVYLSPTPAFDPNTALRLGDVSHAGALDVGASYRGSATFTLPNGLGGVFYAVVVADRTDGVFELDNANNAGRAAVATAVLSRPADLVVSSAAAPASAEAGRTARVTWAVTNRGTGDTAVPSWTDAVYATTDGVPGHGTLLASYPNTGVLGVGETVTRTEDVPLPFALVGAYSLFVVTDVNDTVYEGAREDNNASAALPVTVTRRTPDLRVTAATADATAAAGGLLNVQWSVHNFGTGPTNANYWYDGVWLSADGVLTSDDVFLGEARRTNPLAAGESYTATAAFPVPASVSGAYYVLVQADRHNGVLEDPLEGNNVAATATPTAVTPTAPVIPDLVTAAVDAPADAVSGQPVPVSWTVRNDGDDTGPRSWYDAVYLSRDQVFDRATDFYLGAVYHTGLARGASYTVSGRTFPLPGGLAGPFHVFVAADGGGYLDEGGRELNNVGYDPGATLLTLAPPADLVVGTVTVPVTAAPGQGATVTYSVTNRGSNAAQGTWYDSLYLSADDRWDLGDAFFGRAQHSGTVPGGSSYSETLAAALPGVLPGNYHVIVRTDIRNNIPESAEDNNIGGSLDRVAIDAQALTLGVAATGTLAQGQSAYYRVEVGAGETLLIDFDAASAAASTELYVRFGAMPSRGQFDFGYTQPFAADQRVLVPVTQAGTYYILAYGDRAGEPPAYSVTARVVNFTVLDQTYGRGGNAGDLTLQINGAKFDRTVTARLEGPGGAGGGGRAAVSYLFVDGTRLYATFDLRGAAAGAYDVVVENGRGDRVTVASGLQVVAASPGRARAQVEAPATVRRSAVYSFRVVWSNDTLNDVPAPHLIVGNTVAMGPSAADPASLGTQTAFWGETDGGVPGVLRPGQSGARTLFSVSDAGDGDHRVFVDVNRYGPSDLFNWEAVREELRPAGVAPAAFDAAFARLPAEVGTTAAQVLAVAAANARLLPPLGPGAPVTALLAPSVRRALADTTTSVRGRVTGTDPTLPLALQTVTATDRATGRVYSAPVMADGSFALVALAAGSYDLRLNNVLGARNDFASPVVVADGDRLQGLAITVTGRALAGEVRAASGGAVGEAVAALLDADLNVLAALPTADNGTFVLPALPDGTYGLMVQALGYARAWVDGVAVAGQDLRLEVVLDPEAVVTGRALDAAGQPLGGVTVDVARGDGDPRFAFRAVSNGLGVFTAFNLPAGAYTATLSGAGYATVTRGGLVVGRGGRLDLGDVTLAAGRGPSGIGPQTSQGFPTSIQEAILLRFADAGGPTSRALFENYINAAGPLGSIDVSAQVGEDFKKDDATKNALGKIRDSATKAVEKRLNDEYPDGLPCDHGGVTRTYTLNDLATDFPDKLAQDLIDTHGYTGPVSNPANPCDDSGYPSNPPGLGGNPNFRTSEDAREVWKFGQSTGYGYNFGYYYYYTYNGAPAIIAGGVGEGGGPGGANRGSVFADYRRVTGTVRVTVPAGSNQAKVEFDWDVDIGDTVDFCPGNTLGGLIGFAAEGEKNGSYWDQPFTVRFKADVDPGNLNLKSDPECDRCHQTPPPEDCRPIRRPRAVDPNDILNPPGYGPEHWIPAAGAIPYTIRFENDPARATAPAQVVTITQTLDADLDPRTFRVGDFGFGDVLVSVPSGRSFYQTRVDLTATRGVYVDVLASIDVATGVATWEFRSLDPATGDVPVEASLGFLPPDSNGRDGQGFVRYTVRPRAAAATGTRVDAEARIVFDINEPIDTPAVFNTLDAVAPSGSVDPLPDAVLGEDPSFLVRWSGSDDEGGSALATFTVYVSDNGGPYAEWLANTALTEATFTGTPGHTYGFISVARDNAGNLEAAPDAPDAVTRVDRPDAVPPRAVDVGDVDPDPRALPVDAVDVVFSEPLDPDSLDAGDFTLTRDGEAVALAGLLFAPRDEAGTYRVSGLGAFTGRDGRYVLTVRPEGVRDRAGNPGTGAAVADEWVVDATAPTITSVEQPATPRAAPVASVTVTFSEPVAAGSLTTANVSLRRNGGAELIEAGVTLTPVGAGSAYEVGGLSGLTGLRGRYVLTVTAAGVRDALGNTATGGAAAVAWDNTVLWATSTALTLPGGTVVRGQPFVLTATVTADDDDGSTFDGTVTFSDGATALGTAPVNAAGQAVLNGVVLAGGSHSLTATYGGGTAFAGSATPAAQSLRVQAAATTTTLAATPAGPAVQGVPVTFTATVGVVAPGAGSLQGGTVAFYDNGTTLLGQAEVNATRQATLTTAALTAGSHLVTARYLGVPDDFEASDSAGLSYTVTPAGPVDVTGQTSFTHTGGSLNRRTGRFVQSATLTNTSTTAIQGPVSLVLNLPAGVVLYGATVNGVWVAARRTRDGRYYVDLLDAVGLLRPGQALTFTLEFNAYPGAYTAQVLAGPGER